MERKITQQLLNWKQNGATKPLLIYGARQVGKSYAVTAFGRENYQNLVVVNFERDILAQSAFRTSLAPKDIIKSLESILGVFIHPEKTLLFFDEIQKCPPALTSLKYFAEAAENGGAVYHLIAAGSLLGVTLERGENEQRYTFPVGKVDEIIVYPLDYEEFLWAQNYTWLVEQIRDCYLNNTSIEDTLHQKALELYRHFLVTGGMPRVVAQLIEEKDYQEAQRDIINDYLADMVKYSEKRQGLRNIDAYNSMPRQLAVEKESKRFIFSRIDKNTNSSRDYRDCVTWLTQAKIAVRCNKITVGNAPLKVSEDRNYFKLYLSDTGLLCHQLQITTANLDIYNQNYRGAITENYVACALQSKIQSLAHELYYWKASEKTESAEVDFIIATSHGNIPIEVKSGINIRSQSLNLFVKKYSPPYALRISEKNFGWQNNIKSVPLYAVFCLD